MHPQCRLMAMLISLAGASVFAQESPAPRDQKVAATTPRDDALWKTKTPFEKMPVKITNWSEAKKGLRIGMLVKGAWCQGGRVDVELWVHNQSDQEVAFIAHPGRSDVGVSVTAKDADGHNYFTTNNYPNLVAIPFGCTLPAGYVAKVKDFSFSFGTLDSAPSVTPCWLKFEKIGAGPHRLCVTWSDADPSVSIAGYWTGELTAKDIKFTLGSVEAE